MKGCFHGHTERTGGRGHRRRYLTGNTLFVDGGAHINGVQWAPAVD